MPQQSNRKLLATYWALQGESLRRYGAAALLVLPFVLLDVALATHGLTRFGRPLAPIDIPDRYSAALLTMNVTMAVFAVNFSFIEYQFSPYRSLMRRVAPWQIAAAGAVLLLALTPLLGFAWSEKWTPTAALLIAPVTACTSLGLVLIARRGTRPEAILARALRSRSLTRFADAFLLSAREARLVPPELRERQADLKSSAKVLDEIEPTTGLAESPGDSVNSATSKKEVRVPPPMHEVAWRLTPRSPIDDPFALIIGVALAALQSSDSRSYELALTAALSALDIVDAKATDSLKSPTGRDLDALGAAATLRQHALHSIRRIGLAAQSADKSGAFTATFLSRCAVFLDARPEEPYRDPYPPHGILDAMAEIAEGVIEGSGSPSALIPLVSARWLGTHGTKLRKDRQTDSGFMFDMVLPGYARTMQQLGEAAIDAKNEDFVFRVLEGLGWLGCTAARSDNHQVGVACISGIVQIGRRARAARLECAWSRCALRPADHAWDRLKWILTWVVRIESDGERELWTRSLSEAFSRLSGTTQEVELSDTGGTRAATILDRATPHSVTYHTDGHIRTIDYADQNMLREFELY